LIHERAYAGHSLAWPVLGTTASITSLTRDQLHGYFQSRYNPSNLILLVAGAVDPRETIRMAERICGDWPAGRPVPPRQPPNGWKPAVTTVATDRFQQQSLVLGFPAPSEAHEDRETADVFAAILGGVNSRFFWEIVQAGVAPQVSAGRLDYCDIGMMIAFGLCEPKNAEQLMAAMKSEIAKVTADGVKPDEVQRVKNRTRTGLATEAESPYYRLMQLAGDVDVFGRPRTVSERLAAIERVTVERIAEYLRTWPMTGDPCLISLGPRNWP
jgi:predicted Zn-dependent peptidase